MNKTSPTTRRLDAIGALTHKFVNPENGQVNTDDREMIAREIVALGSLGRTYRWTKAIYGWSDLVRDADNPLQWAIIQGAIFTGFAA